MGATFLWRLGAEIVDKMAKFLRKKYYFKNYYQETSGSSAQCVKQQGLCQLTSIFRGSSPTQGIGFLFGLYVCFMQSSLYQIDTNRSISESK